MEYGHAKVPEDRPHDGSGYNELMMRITISIFHWDSGA